MREEVGWMDGGRVDPAEHNKLGYRKEGMRSGMKTTNSSLIGKFCKRNREPSGSGWMD
jgi:hypothetical protein